MAMRFDVLTLFPELFAPHLESGVTRRAFDTRTGRLLWEGRLPAGGQANPMTYTSGRTGKQYVVITASGARQSADRGDYVIAYALPDKE